MKLKQGSFDDTTLRRNGGSIGIEMNQQITPCAIVHAWQHERFDIAIKRLSLLFERVYYIPPSFASFRGGPEALDKRRRAIAPGGPYRIEGFSWWDDVLSIGAIDVRQSSEGAIAETIRTLEQAQAIIPAVIYPHAAIKDLPNKAFLQTRSAWMQQELSDPDFLRVTDTNLDWQNQPIDFSFRTFRANDGEERHDVAINPPTAWFASEALTQISYLAAELNAIPAFVAPAHVAGLKRRFEKVMQLLDANHDQSLADVRIPEVPVYSAMTGHVLFTLAGHLFEDDVLQMMPPAQIVHLRNTMLIARKQLLDECLRSVEQIVTEGRNMEDVDHHVRAYVRDKMEPALRDFREAARHAKENVLGDIAVRSVQAVCEFSLGTVAGTFAAIALATSPWSLFLAGGFATVARTLPSLARDLKEAFVNERQRQRQGLALIDSVNRFAHDAARRSRKS